MSESLLATDGYKFSMAEAGWPLRRETFYYSHRKGGWQLMPFDVEPLVRAMLPISTTADYEYLAGEEYEMGVGFKAAIQQHAKLSVRAVPRGAWFFDREPVFSVSGPSALVSWLEPLLLQLNFRIQAATLARRDRDEAAKALAVATCEREREIVLETLDAIDVKPFDIRVDSAGYRARVLATAKELIEIVGAPERVFEVGMRAASCIEQHEIALDACREAGVRKTSNVLLARKLKMTPVGTMGHEHVQRYGSDEAAFRAMRDRRPNRSSFLLDTFDTLRSGLVHAFAVMKEDPARGDSIRYDSGDKKAQYRHAHALAKTMGLTPVHILEDGFDAKLTREFEELRRELAVGPAEQVYGYGGYLVAKPGFHALTRDRVSAVYKLAQTGPLATMKFADEAGGGKESVPGEPIVWRRSGDAGAIGIVGQVGEVVPAGYAALTGGDAKLSGAALFERADPKDRKIELSPRTRELADHLREKRKAALAAL
jgi:nicotinate phosphoribosyltransferase